MIKVTTDNTKLTIDIKVTDKLDFDRTVKQLKNVLGIEIEEKSLNNELAKASAGFIENIKRNKEVKIGVPSKEWMDSVERRLKEVEYNSNWSVKAIQDDIPAIFKRLSKLEK